MSQIDFILGPADLTIHRVTGSDHPSMGQSQDQAKLYTLPKSPRSDQSDPLEDDQTHPSGQPIGGLVLERAQIPLLGL